MARLITIPENRDFEDEVEAYGFWCIEEQYFIPEDQIETDQTIVVDTPIGPADVSVINLDEALCPNCAESGIVAVKVVVRSE